MPTPTSKRVLVLGGSGTAGKATVEALKLQGHAVTCFGRHPENDVVGDLSEAEVSVFQDGQFDVVISCLASRSGTADDAWAVDYQANSDLLKLAQRYEVKQFILLSAICVQKPKLAFQQAKLRFEAELIASGLTYSIVRPTAFFKSLSGQIERVQAGKPFLVFGDGELTACKPISDRDLGAFITSCIHDPQKANRILPIGGAGPALTPKAQGKLLFDLLGTDPNYKHVPVWVMSLVVKGLSVLGRINARARQKAELAQIGYYYATESMLVWDGTAYDATATPSFGEDQLKDHYADVLAGRVQVDLGDHAVF